MTSLEGKVVLVTGASSGIGEACAVMAAKRGALVMVTGRDKARCEKVASRCGPKAKALPGDVTDDAQMAKLVDETVRHFGRIDVLINNAGFSIPQNFITDDAVANYDKVMAVNVRAVVKLTHLAMPHLIKSKGNVVNVSSIAAMMSSGPLWSYCMSKAALDHFTRCIAGAVAPKGVRVNSVNPGPVKTSFLTNSGIANEEAFYAAAKAKTALNRVSDADETAEVVLFLASDVAKAVTGSCWVTDNGYLVKNDIGIDL